MSEIHLSICVPTYNRADLIVRLLDSIPASDRIEVVIQDDGSNDETGSLIGSYRRLGSSIKYEWQTNAGRASALRKAILRACGRYVVLMDSDDYFTHNGVASVLSVIDRLDSKWSDAKNIRSAVLGVQLEKDGVVEINEPPEGVITNLIALRADLGIRRDLKELVERDLLQKCMYEIPYGVRRVPTSLLWARVAEVVDCVCVGEVVAVKEYLPGGMTDKIKSLKVQNSSPLYDLYDLISRSSRYRSIKHRLKAALLRQVYALHSGRSLRGSLLQVSLLPIAISLYLYQRKYR